MACTMTATLDPTIDKWEQGDVKLEQLVIEG